VVITLSDGNCNRPGGHELTFFLDAKGIRDGLVRVGNNTILPEGPEAEAEGVRVRYTRPNASEPAGTWGSCTNASGEFGVSADDELDVDDLDDIEARFQLVLTPCDGMAPGLQNVEGSLSVRMRRSLDDVCK
jgi:hypothetical protein